MAESGGGSGEQGTSGNGTTIAPNGAAAPIGSSANPSTAQSQAPASVPAAKFSATQGWYIAAGITVSIALANTKAGPFLVGILGVALLYQINLLLQGK